MLKYIKSILKNILKMYTVKVSFFILGILYSMKILISCILDYKLIPNNL